MIPLLAKFGTRIATLVVLVLAGVMTIQLMDKDLDEDTGRQPDRIAAQQHERATEAYTQIRTVHANYLAETATADAVTKADILASVASEQTTTLEELQTQVDEEKKAVEEAEAVAEAEKKANTNPTSVDIPDSCDEYSGNRATGCAMTLDNGWDLEQFACLEKLWSKESGWNEKAYNAGSGAYGIPQSLPGNKMATTGSDWETNPVTQITWGFGYISGRYGAPCDAWATSQAQGWY